MGQYYFTVNLDKRECLNPHKLGDGLKLWEQLNSQGGIMAALFILLACSNGRGGGDIEEHPLVGRWAGDRIAVVGDYAEDGDLAPEHHAEPIYELCDIGQDPERRQELVAHYRKRAREGSYGHTRREYSRMAKYLETAEAFRDISDEILPLVEKACGVRISGEGWRKKTGGAAAMRPDLVLTFGKPGSDESTKGD